MTYLLLDQGVYFCVRFSDGRWIRELAPKPVPNFPLITHQEIAQMSQTKPDNIDAYTAEARREQAREALDTLLDADLGPISTILHFAPEEVRRLALIAMLHFLVKQPALLQVAKLSNKQIEGLHGLANDAFTAVAAPLIGSWLRKLSPTLKGAIRVYDAETADPESGEDKLVSLIAKAVNRARASGEE